MPIVVAAVLALIATIAFLSHQMEAWPYTATVAATLLLGMALTDIEVYKRFATLRASFIAGILGATSFVAALAVPGRVAVVLLVLATASMVAGRLLAYLRN